MSDPLGAFLPFGTQPISDLLSFQDYKKVTEQPPYCPGCNFFRNLDTMELPPRGALTPEMIEDSKGNALYGCTNPSAWIEPMPMRVTDIQLLRAVRCGSFKIREEQK